MVFFFEWWNLPFVIPIGIGILIAFLMAFSGMDHDAGVDHDVGVDHDFDHDIGHDHNMGHDHDVDSQNSGWFEQSLGFLGLGRVSLFVYLICLSFTWGFLGIVTNQILSQFLPAWLFFWLSLGVALPGSILVTRWVTKGLARILPKTESYGIQSVQVLEGLIGTARYDISPTFGRVQVYDKYKNLQEVDCVVESDADRIQIGEPVVLLRFDPERKVFIGISERKLLQ